MKLVEMASNFACCFFGILASARAMSRNASFLPFLCQVNSRGQATIHNTWQSLGVLPSSHSVPTRLTWTSQRTTSSCQASLSLSAPLSSPQSSRVSSATSWRWTRPVARGREMSWWCFWTTTTIYLFRLFQTRLRSQKVRGRLSTLIRRLKVSKSTLQRFISIHWPLTLVSVVESTKWQMWRRCQQQATFSKCRWRTESASPSPMSIVGQRGCSKNATVFHGRCRVFR